LINNQHQKRCSSYDRQIYSSCINSAN